MKFLGFLIFLFVFLMAFWSIIFLASIIPYMIFVWAKEGKLENNDAAEDEDFVPDVEEDDVEEMEDEEAEGSGSDSDLDVELWTNR